MKNILLRRILSLFLVMTVITTTMSFSVHTVIATGDVLEQELLTVDFEDLDVPEISLEDFDLGDQFSEDLSIEVLLDKDPFFYLGIEESAELPEVTLDNDFEDNSVIVVLNRASSRDDQTFTVDDFDEIGALYVEDLDRLSDDELEYAYELWEAEREIILAANFFAFSVESEEELEEMLDTYLEIREEAAENTLVNFDEYRRILLIGLDENSRENVLDVIEQLQDSEEVYWVGPNYSSEEEVMFTAISNVNFQWAADRISLPQAHSIHTGSRSVRVGVLGSRIDANHSELQGRIRADLGGVFYDDTGNPNPYTWGTEQAGIIGATGLNSNGMIGIAPNVEMVPLRAVNSDGRMPDSAAIAAINHARQMGIPIVTRSFGVTTTDTAFYNAVENYTGLFINSAGNNGLNTDSNPRLPGLSNVIIVGASNASDARWVGSNNSSNFGRTSVHVFAPSGVLTTTPNNGFGSYGGTSSAAPHVAGLAALLLSVNPDLTPQQVRDVILSTVDPVPELANISVSGGRINAYNAVREATRRTDHHVMKQGFVNANSIPLRTGPGTDHSSITSLARNTTVTVLETSANGSWLRVRVGVGTGGREGWINNARITESSVQGFVNANKIPLRTGPGTAHSSITSLARNTTVTVLGSTETGSWLRIRVGIGSHGIEGWINDARITESSVQGFVNANSIPLRTGPGTEHGSITSLARNTTVTVLGSTANGSWLRVRVGISSQGTEGWINDVRITESGIQGFVNANSIPLRTGPGTSFDSIASLERHTMVIILGATPNGSWLRIRVGNAEGWINDARITEGRP